MIRVYARRVIALMENAHFFGDFTVVYEPRKTMSTAVFAINIKTPISLLMLRCCPIPAIACLIYLFPESFFYRFHRSTTSVSFLLSWITGIPCISVYLLRLLWRTEKIFFGRVA